MKTKQEQEDNKQYSRELKLILKKNYLLINNTKRETSLCFSMIIIRSIQLI